MAGEAPRDTQIDRSLDADAGREAQAALAARAALDARLARWRGDRDPRVLRTADRTIDAWKRPREFRARIWPPSTFVVIALGGLLLLRLPGWFAPPGEANQWLATQVAALLAAIVLFVITEYRVGGRVVIDPAARTLTWKRHFTGAARASWRFDEITSIDGQPWFAGSELRITLPGQAFCLPLRHPHAGALADSIRAATALPTTA